MAERRMISKSVIQSDVFLEMPLSSQALYLHLNISADDDGFVGNPKTIIRMIGASEDDFKILIAKGFVIIFRSGVLVITHWKINNYIRKDRYKKTMYLEEKREIRLSEIGSYIKNDSGSHLVYQRSTNGLPSIGEDRLGKVSIDKGRVEREKPSTSLYGQFKNVKLSEEEYKKLEEELKDHTQTMIDKLSRYMESSGKNYKNHYVTILNWYEEDKNKLINKSDKRKTTSNYDDSPSI
ncbi:replisome organizer [Facklamia sp. P12955]|uniref:replisome organizer n=1 Tax=Facklamia sp. P12955 TaxID=3421946 RepID=UPI003D164CAC